MPINFTAASAVPDGTGSVAVPVGTDLDIAAAVRSVGPAGPNGSWAEVAEAVERENVGGFLASTGFRGEIGQTQSVLVGGRHVVAVGTSPAATNDGASRLGAGGGTNKR